MSDLVSGVLTRISELEQAAQDSVAVRGGEWAVYEPRARQWGGHEADPEVLAGGKPIARFNAEYGGAFHAEHATLNDPYAVLRLCRAHRQIVEQYQRAQDLLSDDRFTGSVAECNKAAARSLRVAVEALAVGLGVVEEDR